MLLSILIFLILGNILASCSKRGSLFLILITSLFIALVFTGSRGLADWPAYYYDYLRVEDRYKDNGQFLYHYIVEFFRVLGFSFDLYRFSISIICLTIFYKFITRYSPKPNLVYAGYLCYLIFMDDVQLRNFIACSILYIGLFYIIKHNHYWRIKFFLFLIIASLIHNGFWIYLLLLFIPNDLKKDSQIKRLGIVALIMTVTTVFIRAYISNIILLFSAFASKAETYAETEIGNGGLIYVFLQLFIVIVLYHLQSNYNKNVKTVSDKRENLSYKFLRIVYFMNILLIFSLPTIVLSLTFNRLTRNFIILNTIALTYGIQEKKTRFISIVAFIIYIVVYAYFDFSLPVGQHQIIEPFFNENMYFSL